MYKNMMDRIKRGEEAMDNTSSPIFQLQVCPLRLRLNFLFTESSLVLRKKNTWLILLSHYDYSHGLTHYLSKEREWKEIKEMTPKEMLITLKVVVFVPY